MVGGWRGVCGADSRLPLSAARRPRRARDRPDNVPPYVRASARRGGAAPLDSTVCGGGHLTQTPAAREGTEDHKGGSQTRAAARTRSFKDKLSGRPPAAVQEIALVWWSRGRRLLRTGARVVHLLVLQAKRRWSAPAMPCHVTGHRGWVDHPGLISRGRREGGDGRAAASPRRHTARRQTSPHGRGGATGGRWHRYVGAAGATGNRHRGRFSGSAGAPPVGPPAVLSTIGCHASRWGPAAVWRVASGCPMGARARDKDGRASPRVHPFQTRGGPIRAPRRCRGSKRARREDSRPHRAPAGATHRREVDAGNAGGALRTPKTLSPPKCRTARVRASRPDQIQTTFFFSAAASVRTHPCNSGNGYMVKHSNTRPSFRRQKGYMVKHSNTRPSFRRQKGVEAIRITPHQRPFKAVRESRFQRQKGLSRVWHVDDF